MKPTGYEYQKAERAYRRSGIAVKISLFPLLVSLIMLMYSLLCKGFDHQTWITLHLSMYAVLSALVWIFIVSIYMAANKEDHNDSK